MPVAPGTVAARDRRLGWLLFGAAFVAFASFHQGGGWNQNARFAMVRAIVEEGTVSIDSHLVYRFDATKGRTLRRLPVRDGRCAIDGVERTLAWVGPSPIPLAPTLDGTVAARDAAAVDVLVADGLRVHVRVPAAARVVRNGSDSRLADLAVGDAVTLAVELGNDGLPLARSLTAATGPPARVTSLLDAGEVGASGDVAFSRGRLHPNKAPGTAFLAVPAYFVAYRLERAIGADPDSWRVLTLNAWLTSAFSVGLLSAAAVVVFFRLALAWSGALLASLSAATAFGFGTMFFPYATMLYEHDVAAAALLIALWLMQRTGDRRAMAASGACAGLAAIATYPAAVVVALFGVYLIASPQRRAGAVWFSLGVLAPFLAICAYNASCFGTPFTTNYRFQNPTFSTQASFGMFAAPSWEAAVALLVSPFRGLFFSAPVLALGAAGWWRMLRERRLRAEAWLLVGVVAFFLLTISSFNGWHGGSAVAPRYLLPALPFLALPMVFAFDAWPRTGAILAAISAAAMLLTTAVDPQAGYVTGGLGPVPGRPDIARSPLAASFANRPLTEYEWPFLREGRPYALLEAYADGYREQTEALLRSRGLGPERGGESFETLMWRVRTNIEEGRATPFPLAAFDGPVSVSPMGVYEGGLFALTRPHSEEARFNSFNAGELLFPESRRSLVPVVGAVAFLLWLAFRLARPSPPDPSEPPRRRRPR